jgi:CO/xanthine dehydrogenase FAD-binding subunit
VKPARFEYIRAKSADHVVSLLGSEPDAQLIAGGQTLMPLLNMRLARPALLIDIGHLDELSGVVRNGPFLVIGATTRQLAIETNPLVRSHCPLLAKALPWVGHRPTRARGTIGGSLAAAHPAAEIPLVAATLGAEIEALGQNGTLKFEAGAFFEGPMESRLPADACLVSVSFPVWPQTRIGTSFVETSTRKSDFALASAAAQLALDDSGNCVRAVLGVGGIGPRPVRLITAARKLEGQAITDQTVAGALDGLADQLEILDQPHGSQSFGRRAAIALLRRAVLEAADEAATP